MKGIDLKKWRDRNNFTQDFLMNELGIKSRQTIISWEHSEYIPRIVELAIIALDQIEACRRQSGYKTQFAAKNIAGILLDKLKGYQSDTSNAIAENDHLSGSSHGN